jgi:uncharacterized iron-regulated protein
MRSLVIAITVLFSLGSAASELDMLPLGRPDLAYELGSAVEGGFFDSTAGSAVDFDRMVAAMVNADVVLLGEEHTAMDQKLVHARVLDNMAGSGGRLVLAMEFFQRGDQAALDRWVQGEIDDRGLLEETGWYDRGGYRWEYYRPVMEVARRHRIPVVGVNVPREIPRAVNRGGLEGLTDEQRELVGDVTTGGSPQHRYLISRYFGDTVALLPPGWFDNMYAAQCLWDVVMARSILDVAAEGTTVVLVVGSGHVAYGLGIPRRLDDEREAAGQPPLSIVTLCPAAAPAPDPEGEPAGHPMGGGGHGSGSNAGPPAQFARSLADFIAVFPDHGGVEAFPTLGLRLETDDQDRPLVSSVWPDTLADEVGFASGDVILDVNGRAFHGLEELRFELAEIEWGQRVGLEVRRGDETLEIAALLFPEVDITEDKLAPGYEIEPVTAFDPASSLPVTDSIVTDAPALWTLVTTGDGAERVEVRQGDLLDEVHELDDRGRVVRSLYRHPREDGAVEILYARDTTGAVVAASRIDRGGAEIG